MTSLTTGEKFVLNKIGFLSNFSLSDTSFMKGASNTYFLAFFDKK